MSYRPAPNPGDMRLCLSCPSRRVDARMDFRCAQTRRNGGMLLHPYTLRREDGTEHCGFWPPKHDPEPTLFDGDAA